jgi:hypothetical protein
MRLLVVAKCFHPNTLVKRQILHNFLILIIYLTLWYWPQIRLQKISDCRSKTSFDLIGALAVTSLIGCVGLHCCWLEYMYAVTY